jgi:hypothetical protein
MGAARVKIPARFHADLFCLLFRAFRPLGSEEIAETFVLRDRLQNCAEFSYSLGGEAHSALAKE